MKALLFSAFLVCCLPALAQTETATTPQPPSYANYAIMLVNPAAGGGAVVIMHNPKNELEFVPTNDTKTAMAAGYVPVRAAELGELITTMKDEIAQLTAENAQLRSESVKEAVPASSSPSPAEIEAQMKARAAAEKAARRQQMIQTWLMLQGMNRPKTFNVNVTDCTRYPALCVGK